MNKTLKIISLVLVFMMIFENVYATTTDLSIDQRMGMNGHIDVPQGILYSGGVVREYHNYEWSITNNKQMYFERFSWQGFDGYYKDLSPKGITSNLTITDQTITTDVSESLIFIKVSGVKENNISDNNDKKNNTKDTGVVAKIVKTTEEDNIVSQTVKVEDTSKVNNNALLEVVIGLSLIIIAVVMIVKCLRTEEQLKLFFFWIYDDILILIIRM